MSDFLATLGSRVSGRVGRGGWLMRALRPAWERLLAVTSRGRGVPWSVNGQRFRIDPRVRRLVAPVTERELWDFIETSVRPGDCVLDVGSFLGIHAIHAARLVGPTGRVVCVEPTHTSVRVLEAHLRMNGVADRVTVIHGAVAATLGTAELLEFRDPYRNQIVGPTADARSRAGATVPVLTIDALCKELGFQPTFIRMDIQGAEYSALQGARSTIAAGRGMLQLVVEVHPQEWAKFGVNASAFGALLAGLGLRAVPLVTGQTLFQPDAEVRLEYL